jgi:uncharacterized protein YjbI with pentapeptide repeats
MPSVIPAFSKDPLYQMLRVDDVSGFNAGKAAGQTCNLRGMNLRGLDLRGLDADGLDLTDSYFRDSNLKGIDFSRSILEGASLQGARISGCLFPPELTADEIRLSHDLGTRLRYTSE